MRKTGVRNLCAAALLHVLSGCPEDQDSPDMGNGSVKLTNPLPLNAAEGGPLNFLVSEDGPQGDLAVNMTGTKGTIGDKIVTTVKQEDSSRTGSTMLSSADLKTLGSGQVTVTVMAGKRQYTGTFGVYNLALNPVPRQAQSLVAGQKESVVVSLHALPAGAGVLAVERFQAGVLSRRVYQYSGNPFMRSSWGNVPELPETAPARGSLIGVVGVNKVIGITTGDQVFTCEIQNQCGTPLIMAKQTVTAKEVVALAADPAMEYIAVADINKLTLSNGNAEQIVNLPQNNKVRWLGVLRTGSSYFALLDSGDLLGFDGKTGTVMVDPLLVALKTFIKPSDLKMINFSRLNPDGQVFAMYLRSDDPTTLHIAAEIGTATDPKFVEVKTLPFAGETITALASGHVYGTPLPDLLIGSFRLDGNGNGTGIVRTIENLATN